MASGLFGFFRSSRPAPVHANATSTRPPPTPLSPNSTANSTYSRKRRRSSPLPSGRSAQAVARKWHARDGRLPATDTGTPLPKGVLSGLNGAASTATTPTSWLARIKKLRLTRKGTPVSAVSSSVLPSENEGDGGGEGNGEDEGGSARKKAKVRGSFRGRGNSRGAGGARGRGRGRSQSQSRRRRVSGGASAMTIDIAEDIKMESDEEGHHNSNNALLQHPTPKAGPDRSIHVKIFPGSGKLSNTDCKKEEEEEDDHMVDDVGDNLENNEDLSAMFEPEPVKAETDDTEWEVDADELEAYEQGIGDIDGYTGWTRDEKRLHRLLSLRGFHPLMPTLWTHDFLGVPMYPSLFAPAEQMDRPVVIHNFGSRFRATKALRNIFDLQGRISGLRQTGNTSRIGSIIEQELQRYIHWAAEDAGIDRCSPLAQMPNIVAKRFTRTGGRRGGGMGAAAGTSAESDRGRHRGRGQDDSTSGSNNIRRGRSQNNNLSRRIQDFFHDWAADYRAYYAALPAFPVKGSTYVKAHTDANVTTASSDERRRLHPPRLLYGFVIVQHAVMLLVVDAVRPQARPRCFADFNMSLGDHWLDASLNVAIPVHLARAAQLRCVEGLELPLLDEVVSDEDA